jgi:predicted unusual protein kinase regulating ubiquinone biosynthesis (AarF/ABC1/UbiB family)
MAKKKDDAPVPSTRLGRFARIAKLAGGVAGGMVAEGTRRIRAGERIRARDMLLTPGNAQRVADELANMRGAAMKMGQMLSMDGGDFLPKQLADILARLRSDAVNMPVKQLNQTMEESFGADWQDIFYDFEFKPIAAASIGQVHRAISAEGEELALKIQYPGVAKSIDSDVDNIATLLRLSGLLPDSLDIAPLLAEAKTQLRNEADYLQEAQHLATFADLLAGDERFVVPEVFADLTTRQVLAMSYVHSEPIEVVADLPQQQRDEMVTAMIDLMLQEFFELRLMQTDPNFANYRYQPDSGKIVLLDFGATRKFKAGFVNDYKRLVKAFISGHDGRLLSAAEKLGYLVKDASPEYQELVLEIFRIVLEPLTFDGAYDFGGTDLSARLASLAESVREFREFWQAPPSDAIFFHRKVGGIKRHGYMSVVFFIALKHRPGVFGEDRPLR